MAVIGAGPAGLTAAIYAARGNRNTAIFGDPYDSQLARGGTFENLPGYPDGVLGLDLVEDAVEQAEKYGAHTIETRVTTAQLDSDGFTLQTEDGETRETATIVLATGATHRQMDVEGAEKYEHRGLSYCAYCDGPSYRDDDIAVVGYGNGAAKAAIQLKDLASTVHVISPWNTLRSEKTYEKRLTDATNVQLHFNAEPAALHGENHLESIEYRQNDDTHTLDIQAVFVEYGMEPSNDLAKQLNADLTDKGYIKVERPSMKTSIPGLFAAGDIAGGMKQAATAIGEGASAAITAMNHLED